MAYAGKDDRVGVTVHAVFAFEIKDGPKRSWCIPIGVSEITASKDQILGVQLPDGTVAQANRVFDSSGDFIRNCDEVFGLPAIRKIKMRADYEAREKKIVEQKAVKDLLG